MTPMMNTNMRRILKTPTLRMQSGGDLEAANNTKLQAFSAANPALGAVQAPVGAGRGNINPEMAIPETTARPMAPPPPPILRDGNSFGDAASFRPGANPTGFAPGGGNGRPNAQNMAAANSVTPPGVSPLPAGANPNAGKYGSAPVGAPIDQGAAMDRKVLADSAAAAKKPEHVSRGTQVPAWTPMAMPTIGMKDGGEVSSWSLKGMYNAVTGPKETISQKYERQDAERAARQPKPQPQNAPAPAPAQGISGYVGNGALQRREQAAGLRNGGDLKTGHGGHVPGTGTGDKIPAKYEPGEFVVSNDMLDAEPGLREQLHSLRTGVLAEKGMTPEQADAKAVGGGTLRAAGGFGGVQMPNLDFLDAPKQVASVAPNGLSLTPLPPQTVLPNTTMSNAFAGAKNLRAGIQEGPLPPRAAAAPNFGFAEGPYRSNGVNFDTSPPINDLRATTSAGAAPQTAPRPTASQPSITQMNQPGVDFRNAQYAERMNYEAERARIENPRSMTVKELFSRGDGSTRGPNPMKFAPAVPQSAANLAANIAASAPPAAAPDPTRLQKGLAWADDALTGLGKTKAGGLALRAMNSPVGKLVGKLGGINAQFAMHHGEAGAPTLDAERVAALSRPYDPDWKPSSAGQRPAPVQAQPSQKAQQLAAQAVAPNTSGTLAPVPVKLGDTREVDEYAGTMQVYTKGNSDTAGWTTVSTPAAKQARTLREQAYDQRMKDDYERATNGPNGWKTQEAARLRREEDSTPMSKHKRAALTARRGQEAMLQAAMLQNQTSRDNNAATNAVTLRGQQLDYEGKMVPIRQAAKLREMNASIFKAAGGDNARAAALAQAAGMPAKDFQDALAAQNASDSATQATGTKARENAMKEFRVADSKDPSKWDEVASQQSYDAVRQIFPNIDSTNEQDRGKAMPDAKAMANIFNRARTQDKVGWDAMKFWEAKRPTLNGMPDVSGTNASNIEQVGPFEGMVMLNGSNGHTILTQKDGRKLNLGKLDSRERALLENAQKKGWGN